MSQVKLPKKPVPDWEKVRDEWVHTLEQLVADVEAWCKTNDWPTRRIEKRLEDPRIGEYVAPALMIQVDFVKLLLEPVARFVPGADGLVDLYLMPQYDDVASIYHRNGEWRIHYSVMGDSVSPDLRLANPPTFAEHKIEPFTAGQFASVVRQMV